MSKLREHLNATVFPVHIPKPLKPIMDYVDVQSHIQQTPFDEQYVIDARIRMTATLSSELLLDQPQMRERCIEQMKQAIVEELFGEFRPHLHNLRFAIYKNYQREALDILNKLMEQMYNEG